MAVSHNSLIGLKMSVVSLSTLANCVATTNTRFL